MKLARDKEVTEIRTFTLTQAAEEEVIPTPKKKHKSSPPMRAPNGNGPSDFDATRLLRKNKAKKFDLAALESEVAASYKAMLKEECEETRTALFEAIRDLAYAILKVGDHPKHSSFDIDTTTWEYSLYLFERLLNGTFRPEPKPGYDRFPWQYYINKNLNHILYSKNESDSWTELIEDMEFLIDTGKMGELVDPTVEYHRTINKDKLAVDLWSALRIFYSEDEIRRLLPIATNLMYDNPKYFISDKMPRDVADFTMVLVSTAKRLSAKNVNDKISGMPKSAFNKALSSSVRSTVFLSSVVNAKFFPREFLLSLDIDSLYRLVQIAGGKRLKIPTQRDLNTLIGSVVAVSKVIMEGKDVKESINTTKKELDLVFSHEVNINSFVSRIIESMQVFGEDEKTDPMIQMLVLSIKSLETLMNQFLDKMDKADPNTVLKSYEQLSNTLSGFTQALITLSDRLERHKSEAR